MKTWDTEEIPSRHTGQAPVKDIRSTWAAHSLQTCAWPHGWKTTSTRLLQQRMHITSPSSAGWFGRESSCSGVRPLLLPLPFGPSDAPPAP